MRDYDWDDLRCFLEVATQRSTLSAARSLKLHQTTVARRLDALEYALGVRLFDRSAAGYALSPAGVDLLPFAQAVAEATKTFKQRADIHVRRRKQIVRITTSDVLANLIITPALPEFTAAHPGVQVHTLIDDRKLDLGKGCPSSEHLAQLAA